MPAEPEAHVLLCHADELVLLSVLVADRIRRVRGAQLVEAVRIEFLWGGGGSVQCSAAIKYRGSLWRVHLRVGIVTRIMQSGRVRGLDMGVRGDVSSVLQRYWLERVPSESVYACVSVGAFLIGMQVLKQR